VQAVRTIFDTPNHFPLVSALARNLPSFLSLRIWLLGNAVASLESARGKSDVTQCSWAGTLPEGGKPSGADSSVRDSSTTNNRAPRRSDAFSIGQRGGDPVGNFEVRRETPGERTLRRLDEPARVPDEPIRARGFIQPVEKTLNLTEAISRTVVAVIPNPEAEILERTQDEHGVDASRIRQPAVPARPAMALPEA
jgi:hypothetical protein